MHPRKVKIKNKKRALLKRFRNELLEIVENNTFNIHEFHQTKDWKLFQPIADDIFKKIGNRASHYLSLYHEPIRLKTNGFKNIICLRIPSPNEGVSAYSFIHANSSCRYNRLLLEIF